jgi:uroporphyrinogen decarboxylase
VPVIHFGTGTASLLPLMREAGGTVLGLDWRTPLAWGRQVAAGEAAIQGNLDPVALFAPRAELERRVRRVLLDAGSRRGHIFNLGHGILQHTPVEAVRFVVDLVHELTAG